MTRIEQTPIYEFGPFRLDPAERLLLRTGQPVALKPKAFDLLVFLVERSGRLVPKQELIAALWPDTFVEEANLTYTVSAVRKALGDLQDGERFIQTVPTRGYRFVAPVTLVDGGRQKGDQPRQTRHSYVLPLALGLAVALALKLTLTIPPAARRLTEQPSASQAAWLSVPLPHGEGVYFSAPSLEVSPDGRHLAFGTFDRGEGRRIWLRSLDSPVSQPMPGTDAALGFSWSPDSQRVAFLTPTESSPSASLHLETISVPGGEVQTLCEVPYGRIGSWSRRGVILLTSLDGGLISVEVSGWRCGTVTRLEPSGGDAHVGPHFLPDGRRFLYQVLSEDPARTGLYVGSLDSESPVRVPGIESSAIFASGHLLFRRAGAIAAQPFDADRLELRGEMQSLGGRALNIRGGPTFSASDTGVLAYPIHEFQESQFMWFTRAGERVGPLGEPGPYANFDISPDGTRLVLNRVDDDRSNLWVLDLERGVAVRRTFGESYHTTPRWAPDGQRVAAMRRGIGPITLVEIAVDGSERLLVEPDPGGAELAVDDWSPDGRFLLFRRGGGLALLALPLTEEGDPLLVWRQAAGFIDQAYFSPDSRWIAFNSNESGRFEVYLVRFPPDGERWQISTQGGVQPLWSQDGREIYYLGLDGTLLAVPLTFGDIPRAGRPQPLFLTPIVSPSPIIEDCAVAADGQRFLFKTRTQEARTSIGVLLDWPALLRPGQSR